MGNKMAKAAKGAETPVPPTGAGAGAGAAKADAPKAAVATAPVAVVTAPPADVKVSMNDFDIIKVLGRGAFGKVMLVKKKADATNTLYALKSLKKADLVKANQVEHTATERYVLEQLHSPFLVHLSFAFQSPEKLYIVMDYLTGGELFFWLKKQSRFTEGRAKLYMAECVLAIEALHEKDIIHRDLKPENILLDKEGHVKVVDYGLAKGGITSSGADDGGTKTKTFCGTPEYVSPELIENRGHGKGVDWWALGAILHEMMYGLPPFYDQNTNTMYRKILHDEIKFKPSVQTSEAAKVIIRKMLEKQVGRRLGSVGGAAAIKNEPFFASLEMKRVMTKKYTPEFIPPRQKNDADARNFDTEFTDEKPAESLSVDVMTDTMQAKADFSGFTYQAPAP